MTLELLSYLELEYYGKGGMLIYILANTTLEKYRFPNVLYTTLLNKVGKWEGNCSMSQKTGPSVNSVNNSLWSWISH